MLLIPIKDHNPYKRFPIVTIALIAINVWVFLRFGVSERSVFHFGAVPCDLLRQCPAVSEGLERAFPDRSPFVSIFTSMFTHGGLAHLAGNMLYLWVFGNNVEDRLGKVRFTVFYFVCGLAAAFAHILVSRESAVPIVGASGAVSGVLGAYLHLWPRTRVTSLLPVLFFIPIEVSAKLLLGMWFALQLLNAVGSLGGPDQGAGVAFMAHVGGFIAGWLLVRVMAPPIRRVDPLAEWYEFPDRR